MKNSRLRTKTILTVSAIASPFVLLPIVVSCNEKTTQNNLFSEGWNISKQLEVDEPISTSLFKQKCTTLDATRDTFIQYTNLEEIEQELNKQGIFIKQISSVFENGTINSLNCNIVFTDGEGKREEQFEFVILNFITSDSELEKVVFDFKENIVPLLRAKTSNMETSEDVWNTWWNAKPYERTALLFSYIDGLTNEILNDKTFTSNGIRVKVDIPSSFKTVEEANKQVFWNSEEQNNSTKGNTLTVTFNLSTTTNNGDVVKAVKVPIKGFTSFQTKIDYFANNFVSSKGNIIINNPTIPTRIICGDFAKETNYDLKLKGLSNYLGNLPNPYQANENGVIYKLKNATVSNKNQNWITLTFDVIWNNLIKEVSFDIFTFIGDQEYFYNLKAELLNLQLSPTQLGTTKSSEYIYNEYKKDPSSLTKYVAGIPKSTEYVKYEIGNISWNEQDSIQYRGSILKITLLMSYANYSTQLNLLPITGFTTEYSVLLSEFEKKCSQINLSLKDTVTAKKIIVDDLTSENITKYVDGIPVSTPQDKVSVSNIKLDKTQGAEGIVNVSFIYSWETDIYTYERRIAKSVYGFKRYDELSAENYLSVINDMVKNNYLDLIKKKGVNYGDWLTSYFVADQSSDALKFQAISNLWEFPTELFGVEFKLLSIAYSRTRVSLKDTELSLRFQVKDIYNNKTFNSKEFIVEGFYDPYSSEARSYISKEENSDINLGNIERYSDVDSILQMGEGNGQNTWPNYWLNEPYKFYAQGQNNSTYQNKWVEAVKPKVTQIFNRNLQNASISLDDLKFIWKGNHRYGTKDTNGTCPAPISVKFTYTTKAVDKKGHSAQGKYNNLSTKYLTLWFYFKNMYWKG